MNGKILIIILLLLQGCSYYPLDKERYREWYNAQEKEIAHKNGEEPKLITKDSIFY